jgi:anti-sigma regulatory factor (Ser/Thr protein kinase)
VPSLRDGHVSATAASDTALLVSELVTNSVRHANAGAHEALTLEVLTLGDRLRVIVTDPGCKREPRSVARDAGTPGGFGLFLVEALSESWGVGHDGVGPTRVWCELLID